ncbi:hypothetical protein TIFTF001_038033 [Ficus carica]|uniref:Retrotransposon gag domain-containing protein n=1 Tax=Ficus carica TaxID=3494 RepID=A0AA88EHW3_FICCA|nr:hypothetical protein TIFTF001_038033 [Ficus carica]
MMASKLPRVVPTCLQVRFGQWFELDCPWQRATVSNLSTILDTRRRVDEDRYAAWIFQGMSPLLFDRTRRTMSPAGWLNDMETIFRVCHIEAHFQVMLASRCLAGNARLWWLTLGLPDVQGLAWVDFRAFILVRFGPLPDEGANRTYRDPEIYNDMYRRQYLSYVAEWYTYPNESMSHIAKDSGRQCCLIFLESWMTRSGGHCMSLEMGYRQK